MVACLRPCLLGRAVHKLCFGVLTDELVTDTSFSPFWGYKRAVSGTTTAQATGLCSELDRELRHYKCVREGTCTSCFRPGVTSTYAKPREARARLRDGEPIARHLRHACTVCAALRRADGITFVSNASGCA